MIITARAELRRLDRARSQPNVHFLRFPVLELLDAIRREHFPHLNQRTDLLFVNRGPLACIAIEGHRSIIYVHQILNDHDTPRQVLSLVCKHELIHVEVPSVMVGKREIDHPPEFWSREKAIAPERKEAWHWITVYLFPCLKRRPRLQRIDVLPNWKQMWAQPKIDILTGESCSSDSGSIMGEQKGW